MENAENKIRYNPPLEHIKIGTNRTIDLFTRSVSTQQKNQYYDESLTSLFENSLGHTNAYAIGAINGYIGLFVTEEEPFGKVYSFNTFLDENQLILVASTVENLYEIIQRLNNEWKLFLDIDILSQNPATFHAHSHFMRYIQRIDPIHNAAFWEFFGFSELLIGLE